MVPAWALASVFLVYLYFNFAVIMFFIIIHAVSVRELATKKTTDTTTFKERKRMETICIVVCIYVRMYVSRQSKSTISFVHFSLLQTS